MEKIEKCCDCGTPRSELKESSWGTKLDDGTWGIRCKSCEEKRIAKKIKEFQESEHETDYTSEIICPYCGHHHRSDGTDDPFESEGEYEFRCGECAHDFIVKLSVTFSYSTSKD